MFAGPAYIHEFPHPPAVVQFHPRKDQPFTLDHMTRALALGVQGVELDLLWRSADSTIVCSHERRGLEARPTMDDALGVLLRFRGDAATVHRNGRQFFLVLDLKDESPPFHRALVRSLAAHSAHFSTSALPSAPPRGITVVLSGFRAALEQSLPRAALDTLCLVEGRDYGARIRDLSGRGAPFQWLALEYPVERSRVCAVRDGRDSRAVGRFNVRVVGARGRVEDALRAGADAVNVDLDEIPEVSEWCERPAAVPASP